MLKPTRLKKADKQKEDTKNAAAIMFVLMKRAAMKPVPDPTASQTLEIFLENPIKESVDSFDQTILTQLEEDVDDVKPLVAKKTKLPVDILT